MHHTAGVIAALSLLMGWGILLFKRQARSFWLDANAKHAEETIELSSYRVRIKI